jgi:hypothetical protein
MQTQWKLLYANSKANAPLAGGRALGVIQQIFEPPLVMLNSPLALTLLAQAYRSSR